MKSPLKAMVLAIVIATPLASFAQSNPTVTGALIGVEGLQLERGSYRLSASADSHRPEDVQAPNARVVAPNGSHPAGTDVGDVRGGVSASGHPVANEGMKPLYFGH
jgi:hypothetical protein